MAEKKIGTTYEAVMRDLKSRKYAPFYLLMGEESYFIDKISDYIESTVLAPEERDFNLTIVFGADTTGGRVADLARRYPMMAEHQVIIVKEAQALKGLDGLEKYLDKPVGSTILVMCHKNGSVDKRKKLVTKALAMGVVLESKKLYDRQLPQFIETYLRQRAATIEPKATQMMADHVGADLSRLASELDKILISLPDNDHRITPEIVEREVGISKDFNIYELLNAVVSKNVYKANLIVNYFDNNPKAGSIYTILPTLFTFFQNLLIAFYTPDRNNVDTLVARLGLRGTWAAKEYLTAMRVYNARKALQIIEKLREIDAKSKGVGNPSTPEGELLRELIFFILH